MLSVFKLVCNVLSTEVKLDPGKTWCPVLECQAVCDVPLSSEGQPSAVPCPTCHTIFCSGCRGPWQGSHTCPEQQPMKSHYGESRSVRQAGNLKCCVWKEPYSCVGRMNCKQVSRLCSVDFRPFPAVSASFYPHRTTLLRLYFSSLSCASARLIDVT